MKLKPYAISVTLSFIGQVAIAQADCSLLDPRASISQEKQVKIQGSIDTLYKIAKANASIDGKLKDEIQNLQAGSASVSERYAIAARTLYIFRGMVANANDLSTERKFQLFQAMQENIRQQPTPEPPTGTRSNAPSSDRAVSRAELFFQLPPRNISVSPTNIKTTFEPASSDTGFLSISYYSFRVPNESANYALSCDITVACVKRDPAEKIIATYEQRVHRVDIPKSSYSNVAGSVGCKGGWDREGTIWFQIMDKKCTAK